MNSVDNKIERQREYLSRHAEKIAAFARARHARQGRGIVIVDWPAPDFPKPEEVPVGAGYISTTLLTSKSPADTTPLDPMVEAATRYNPNQQAIVVFIDSAGEMFDFHVLTAIYGYTN